MGYLQEAGGKVSSGWKDLTGGIGGIGKEMFGSYKPMSYDVNKSAFTDTTQSRKIQNSLGANLAKRQGLTGPQMANDSQFRGGQATLAAQLAEQAAGRGPSVATNELQRSTDRGIKQAMAMAASNPGVTAGQRARMASNEAARIRGEAGMNAANARINEQNVARQTLGGVLAQGRQQDIGVGQTNLAAALQAQDQKDKMTQFYKQSSLDLANQDRQAGMSLEQLLVNQQTGMNAATQAAHAAKQKNYQGWATGAAGALPGLVAMSDETTKTDIKSADKNLGKFLSKLSASDYEYKDKKHGQGRFVSPMAQELEKSEIGKSMVVETPGGKMVDYGRAAGTYLSAAAMLHKRLNKLEKSLGQTLAEKRVA